MNIKCIVACHNSNGEPDLFFVKVEATEDQIENGEHYDRARREAELCGYDAGITSVTFDESDSAGKAMLDLFQWDTSSIIKA